MFPDLQKEIRMAAEYSTTAKFFHWTAALLVLTIVPMGLLMGRIPEGLLQDNLFFLHKSLGALILFIMTLRIIYRFAHGAPTPEPTLKPWEHVAAETVHWSLYAMLIATPMIALWGYSVYGQAAPFFGIFQIPPFTAKNEHLAEQIFYIHGWMGWAVGALLCLHIAAALNHHFIRGDGVLRRMLPGNTQFP
jgi:cytochrome b561